ncbi:MAG: acyltransferase [Puniceicoccales bacterium]|jgi:peptidoglycan/LPS O-acetylase OafA/YrhL|nr:acyltransferase [Puniceicoccales bacterium]
MQPTQQNEKILGIEVLRFLCACSILVWHYWHFSFGNDLAVKSEQPFHVLFYLFYTKGSYAVQIFWMISGYIFFWKYRNAIADRSVGFKKFCILRISRLYPLHVATLLLVLVMQYLFFAKNGKFFIYQDNGVKSFILHIFMANFWVPNATYSFNAPIWSVSLEIIVYFIFFFCTRYLGQRMWQILPIFGAALLLLLVSGYGNIFWCMLFFYAGGLVNHVQEFMQSIPKQQRKAILWNAFLLIVEIGCCLKILHADRAFRVMLFGAVAIYVFVEYVKIPSNFEKFVEMLGNLTYSSYLIHFPVQLGIALVYSHMGRTIPFESHIFFLAFFAIVFVMSRITFVKIEVVAMKKIRKAFLG